MIDNITHNVTEALYNSLDRELYDLLRLHGFDFRGKSFEYMREELKKKGYELILEQQGDIMNATYTFKLCKVIDTKKLKFNVNFNVGTI